MTHLFPLLTQYDDASANEASWLDEWKSTDRYRLLKEHRKRGELAERGAKRLTDLEASLVLARKASDEEVVALLERQRRKDVFRVADQIVEPLGDSPLDGNAYVEERREEWLPLSEFKKVLRSRGYSPDPGYDYDLVDRDRAGDEDLQAIYMDLFEAKNIGQYDGDQDGNTGDNYKLKKLGWTPSVKLEDGIKKFYNDVKGKSL